MYQHFPREPRESFIQQLAARLRIETRASGAFSFRTPHVLFLLAAQGRHIEAVRGAVGKLNARWHGTQMTGQEIQSNAGIGRIYPIDGRMVE